MCLQVKYIYGVIEPNDKRNFGSIGIDDQGNEVYVIPHLDIGAVVSDSTVSRFDSLPKETVIHYLVTHQFVIEEVMKSYTIIPMKFGTMAANEAEVQKILQQGYSQFKRALEEMDNKIELDVVALWSDLNAVLQEIGEQENIKEAKQEVANKSSDEVYDAKIKVGKLVKSLLDERRDKCAAEIIAGLREVASDFRSHELMDDSMIMNTAFLMHREEEKAFDRKVNELNEKYEEKVNFRVVGPLPLYSFSTVEVKKVEFESLDAARKTLELAEEVTIAEVKEVHRALMQKWHPDKNPQDPQAEEKFKKITEAYKLLMDYFQRYKYSLRKKDVHSFLTVRVLKGLEEAAG